MNYSNSVYRIAVVLWSKVCLEPCKISITKLFCKTRYQFSAEWPLNGTLGTRSSHQTCSIKKGVLRNFTKLSGKHLWQSLFFNKVAGLRPATLLKKRLWHRYFPVNFVKFLRTAFLQNTSGRLLLEYYHRALNGRKVDLTVIGIE